MKIRHALGGLAMLVATGCAQLSPASRAQSYWEELSKPHVLTTKAVEREINKWDPWLTEILPSIRFTVRDDEEAAAKYHDGELSLSAVRTSRFFVLWGSMDSEKFPPETWDSLTKASNLQSDTGAVHFEVYPDSVLVGVNKWFREQYETQKHELAGVKDAIDHELTHALFFEAKRSIRNSPFYRGPSQQDFAKLALGLYKDKQTKLLIDSIAELYVSIPDGYPTLESFLAAKRKYTPIEAVDTILLNPGLKGLYKRRTWGDERLSFPIHGWNDSIPGLSQEDSAAVEWLNERYLHRNDVMKDSKDFVFLSKQDSTRSYIVTRAPQLVVWFEQNDSSYEYGLQRMDSYARASPLLKEVGLDYLRDYVENTERNLMFGEWEARIMNGLANAYVGAPNTSCLPAPKDVLDFYAAHTYKGQPMFRSFLEKRAVGEAMVRDGVDPATVQRKLEYAKHFKYHGKSYDWPGNNFRFAAPIPFVDGPMR